MNDQETDADKDKEVEVKTSLGSMRLRGYHLGNVLQIVAAVLLALMAMMMYEMRAENKIAIASMVATAKHEHDKLGSAIEKGTEAQQEMNYILTLHPADREKLNMRMPDSLRRKISER